MSIERGNLGLSTLALLATLAVTVPGCKRDKPAEGDSGKPTTIQLVTDDMAGRVDEAIAIDARDKEVDFPALPNLRIRNKAFLLSLAQNDPQGHNHFLFRLKEILKIRRKPHDEDDVEIDLDVLDLEALYKMLALRESTVSPDGTVKFPTKEAEQRTSLAELTPDESMYVRLMEKTQEKMGIRSEGPIRVFRLKKDTPVTHNGKTVLAKAGTFVVNVRMDQSTTELRRVLIYDGDQLIDSLSKDFTEPAKKAPKAPVAFENFLKIKLPNLSLNNGRDLFKKNRSRYEEICRAEFPELLKPNGMPFDKHIVYYLQWAEANRVPINEDTMREFFTSLLNRRKQTDKESELEKTPEGESPQKEEPPKTKADQIVDQADDSMQGAPDQDENILSYEDTQRRKAGEAAEFSLKAHGPLFAIIRQAGSFFDPYTYNRLMNNFTTRVGTTIVGKKEYLVMRDLSKDLEDENLPNDVRRLVKPSSFVERINRTTTFNKSTDEALKAALAFSAQNIESRKVNPGDFEVHYGEDGRVTAILLKGKLYDPKTFITPPSTLGNPKDNTVRISFGGMTRTIDLQDYFDRYRRLEAERRGQSQMITFFNARDKRTAKMRNPAWFTESGDSFYRGIAEEITAGANSATAKLLKIGQWLQHNLDYINEITERNKLTMGTFMDRGGDCEDSYAAYKTLANSIGLGHMVGGILFKEHVAAMVKGSHGATRYNINGELWTIVETATGEGHSVKPGETPNSNPRAFLMPNGEIVKAANSDFIPLKTVAESALDKQLVSNFDADREALLKWTKDPKNQPKKENMREGSNLADEGKPHGDKLIAGYAAIAKSGEMAEAVSSRYSEALGKIAGLMQKWADFHQKEAEKERAAQVAGEPKLVGEAGKRYIKARRHFHENIDSTYKRLAEILRSCVGKEGNAAAISDCHSRMVDVINSSNLVMDFGEMKEEFHETLIHAGGEMSAELEKDLEKIAQLLNNFIYAPYNAIRDIHLRHQR
ncbi:MAG: hypothetical protein O3B47_00440 [bacterium]|nr:hypothetical protein [bacterium]